MVGVEVYGDDGGEHDEHNGEVHQVIDFHVYFFVVVFWLKGYACVRACGSLFGSMDKSRFHMAGV